MSVNPQAPLPSPRESQRESELRVGEPIVGYRSWRVRWRHGVIVLEGIHFRAHWPRGRPIRGRCMIDIYGRPVTESRSRRDVAVPCPVRYLDSPQDARWGKRQECIGCKMTKTHPCGVYAAKNQKDGFAYQTSAEPACVGTVALWGRIVEHELGWRAQFAYPKSLTVNRWRLGDDPDQIAEEISQAYGVPCDVRPREETD